MVRLDVGHRSFGGLTTSFGYILIFLTFGGQTSDVTHKVHWLVVLVHIIWTARRTIRWIALPFTILYSKVEA